MARLPITDFLTQRLREYDPTFEVRKGTAFEQLYFKPLQFILQPFRDEGDVIQQAQSFRRILLTDDPDAFSEEAVDALAANLFVDRVTGSFSGGVARVYYDSPVNREWPVEGAFFTGSNGKNYVNPAPFAVTVAQMSTKIENGLYYYDIPVVATEAGEDGDLDVGGLVSLSGDPDVITVTNPFAFSGGRARETNTQLIERTKKSIAVRDLVTGKGFNATLFENFPTSLTELQPIGFGDEEMMRDIVFNTHIGGRVDGYVKTPNILTKTKNFVGLLLDTTRQSRSTTNLVLTGTDWLSIGQPNLDRSNGLDPVVQQAKASTAAVLTGTADLSALVNLAAAKHVRITIDTEAKEVNCAGLTPAATSKNEIVSKINLAFGRNVASLVGNYIRLTSVSKGLTSYVSVDDPVSLPSALFDIFGFATLTQSSGDGPITFTESDHYVINDVDGQIQRVLGAEQVAPASTGESTSGSDTFVDATPAVFASVAENDILTILSGPDAGDYRIVDASAALTGTLVLDAELTDTSNAVDYTIRRTGIKDGETVYVQFYFNPLSIDIGKYIQLDDLGRVRGVRPGREDQTITDVAFLRIKQIELIDPITEEPVGEILSGNGGYGVGGYGEGPYGIGSGADYYLVVNKPHERFSAFEDSYIVISSAFQGFSFAVTYDYVPEVESFHNFVRSESERVLDGDILIKHFLPAYVSGTIRYSVDSTDSLVPDNETMTSLVKEFINLRPSNSTLDYSDIAQFITRVCDPFDRYGASVKPFELTAMILNTDGSTTVSSGSEELVVPKEVPFPKDTPKPLSPRITHWIADEIVLERL